MTLHKPARRRTKIVATLGPATSSPEMIRDLILRGINCARINASHGTHEGHAQLVREVRKAAEEAGRPVAILYDLQGPKIRIGALPAPVPVVAGQQILLSLGREPGPGEIPVDYPLLDRDVKPGQPLLIDDGGIETVVTEVEPGSVRCRVLNEGRIHSRKGINLPASRVSAPGITEKDREDALFAQAQGVDLIALSFVRRAEDVRELRSLLKDNGKWIPIIAKIEKPQALDELNSILDASWGIMVARGDLGVELSPEEVPSIQKRLIREARRLGRPVIIATQMLESMTRSPRPTRAEASDVASAVYDGADAVMLSAETATGSYPSETVEMMARIIHSTEMFMEPLPTRRRRERGITTTPEAVADAGCQVAHHLQCQAIVAFTQSDKTAILASQRRPDQPIVAFTHRPEVRNRLALAWGVRSYLLESPLSTEELVQRLDAVMLEEELGAPGDRVVLLMGVPVHTMGATNLMQVHTIGTWSPIDR